MLSGSTLTVLNGATTVATLALGAAPIHGAYAVVQADATLGGIDMFLSNQPPVAPAGLTLAPASDSGTKGDNVTNVAAPLITGTGIAGDTIALLDGATSVGTATVAAGGTWSIAATTLVEGSNILTATQSDTFGNASTASAALSITLDTVAPVLTAALVSDTGSSVTDHITRNAALTGTADANSTVTISNGATVLRTTTAGAGGAWNFTPVGLADGTYALTATETDLAGNTGSTTLGFTLDTTAPVLTAALVSDTGSSPIDHNTRNAALTGTADANSIVTVSNGATVLGTTTAGAGGVWNFTPVGLADGSYTLTAAETDLAGNSGSVGLGFILDTVAPAVTAQLASDTGGSATDRITSNAALTGTADANSTVTISNGTTVLRTTTASAGGAWTFTPAALADGSYNLTATETDLAGNTGSATLGFTLDTVAPVLTAALVSDTGSSPTDHNTSNAALTGTAEASRTVTVSNGATLLGTTTAGADGAWSFTPAGLADGAYTLTAAEVDVAGNTGSIAIGFILDTVAPTVTSNLASDTGGSATDRITSNATLAGTAEAGRTVTVSNGATVLGTTTAGAGGTWSFSPLGLADGNYSLNAAETDVAGNTGSTALAFTLDTTAPTVTAALASDTGSSTIDRITHNAALTGTAEAGRTITVSNGATVLGTTTANASGAWNFTPTGLADGNYNLTAAETDAAGNPGSTTLAFTLDTTAPTVTGALAFDTGGSTTDRITANASLTGTAEAGRTVTISNGATVLGTATASAGGGWNFSPAGLADGAYTLTASETDVAGNTGSATLAFSLDTAAPTVTATLVSDTGSSSTDLITRNAALTGTAEAGRIVTISNGATVLGTTTADVGGAWSFTPVGLTDGSYALTASATDAAGNTGSASLAFTFDTTAPAAPGAPDLAVKSDNGVSNTDNITNVTTPTFTGTAAPNTTVTLLDGDTVIGGGQADAAGNWSMTTSALAAGVHAIAAQATDLAGNVGVASVPLSVTIDVTAPVAPSTPDLAAASDSGASSTDNITNAIKPNFTGTAEANATITMFDGGIAVGIGQADALGIWSVTTGALSDGVHAITATATDLAGNPGAASAALSVTIDSVAPAAPGIAQVSAVAISGTAEANSSFALFDGLTQIGTASTSGAGAWSIPIALAAGTHALTGTATDLVGNVSATSSVLAVVIGTPGNDVLAGGPGAVIMLGSTGNDTYIVDNTGDVVTENVGEGVDKVSATASYTLAAGSEIEILTGSGAAALTLAGNEFANTITGGTGNDTLTGGGGNDTFVATSGDGNDGYDGGTGIDTYDLSQTSAAATVSLATGTAASLQTGNDTLVAIENVIGGSGSDNITGDASSNNLSGGAGNDTLDGGAGADTMTGGTGNDTYTVDNAADVVIEAVGQGTDTINTSVSYTLSAGSEVENLTAGVATGLSLAGNEFNNTITGGAGNDTLTGGAGNDRFVATVGDGNDTYDGGLGTDTYDLSGTTAGAIVNLGLGTSTSADTGTDTLTAIENVVGSAGNDTFVASVGDGNNSYNGGAGTDTYDLSATSANATVNLAQGTASSLDIGTDTLTLNSIENVIGGAGNDTLVGDARNNVLIGGAGNDTLNGNAGADTMLGGLGNDSYVVDNAGDVVTEAVGQGIDTVFANVGYALAVGSEVETVRVNVATGLTLTGNEFSNTIIGNAGNDTLFGGAGNDILSGLAGADTMAGGTGNDTYTVDNAADVVIEAVGQGTDTVNTSVSYTLSAGSEVENLTCERGDRSVAHRKRVQQHDHRWRRQ